MTDIGAQVLEFIQRDFPLAERPFAEVGRRLGLSEAEVLSALRALYESRALRALALVFEPRRVGYTTTLVAMRAPAERLDEIAAIVSEFPEVTHNYSRNHAYSLWFAMVARSAERVAEVLEELRTRTGIEHIYPLRTRRRFKIAATFRLTDEENELLTGPSPQANSAPAPAEAPVIIPDLVRELARGLQLVEEPFAELAERVGLSVDEIYRYIRLYLDSGIARRFGALIRPLPAGLEGNAMVVWNVPGGSQAVQHVGQALAQFEEVTHCYERDTMPEFPYNLYSMVYGRTRQDCIASAAQMAERVGVSDYLPLFTVREYKKTSPAYFPKQLDPETRE